MPSDEDLGGSAAAFVTNVKRSGGYCEVPDEPGLGVSLADDYATIAPPAARPLSSEGLLRSDGSVASAS